MVIQHNDMKIKAGSKKVLHFCANKVTYRAHFTDRMAQIDDFL